MLNHEERASRAWPLLVDVARRNDTITYSELAQAIDVHVRAIRFLLGPIQDYCIAGGLPPLTVLVVAKGTNLPGSGFIGCEDLDEGLSEVRAYPWEVEGNPFLYARSGTTRRTLVDTLVARPEDSGQVYALVEQRGMVQVLFREALLEAYEGACAFCGLSFHAALDACHIVPWAHSARAERLDVRNGLLLCATHHRLFDAGWLDVTEDLIIAYSDVGRVQGEYSGSDHRVADLHGKRVFVPVEPHHRLWPDALSRRKAILAQACD